MEAPNIFSYSDPLLFVKDSLSHLQRREKQLSLRKWAAQLGLSSHALIAMILNGKRPLSQKHASLFSKGFSLSPQEGIYLQALIQLKSAQSIEEQRLCQLWLSELNPGNHVRIREFEEFQLISHWVHTAILAMTFLSDFDCSVDFIFDRLKGKVEKHIIREAIERLFHLKLLQKDTDGAVVATAEKLTSKNDNLNQGVRNYHRQVCDLAKDAVEQVPLDMREFQSFSLAIKAEKIPLAKEMIRRFRAQLEDALGGKGSDEVFQVALQLFQVSEVRAKGDVSI